MGARGAKGCSGSSLEEILSFPVPAPGALLVPVLPGVQVLPGGMAMFLQLIGSILLAHCLIIIQFRLCCGVFVSPEGLEYDGHGLQ